MIFSEREKSSRDKLVDRQVSACTHLAQEALEVVSVCGFTKPFLTQYRVVGEHLLDGASALVLHVGLLHYS